MSHFVVKAGVVGIALGLLAVTAPANAGALDDGLKVLVVDQENQAVEDSRHPDQDQANAPGPSTSGGGDAEIQGLQEEFPQTDWPKKD